MKKIILGIETSCDETAVAILNTNGEVLSNVVHSQISIHANYGGVVPELASRDHAIKIKNVTKAALKEANLKPQDLDYISVTQGPGLLGCLIVGMSFAKSLAMSLDLPLIPVDHVKAHLMTALLENDITFPFAGLVASGGHSSIYIAKSHTNIEKVSFTIDDAAGEVFDKIAKYVEIPYPGGKKLSDLAKNGKNNIKFPKPKVSDSKYNFSFSGLKTSVINYIKTNNILPKNDNRLYDVFSSFQETISSILSDKLIKVAKDHYLSRVVMSGGVAANQRLREIISQKAKNNEIDFFVPKPELCTDNAVMVANLARFQLKNIKEQTFTSEMNKIKSYPSN